jgi:hypothetical protein
MKPSSPERIDADSSRDADSRPSSAASRSILHSQSPVQTCGAWIIWLNHCAARLCGNRAGGQSRQSLRSVASDPAFFGAGRVAFQADRRIFLVHLKWAHPRRSKSTSRNSLQCAIRRLTVTVISRGVCSILLYLTINFPACHALQAQAERPRLCYSPSLQ